ncbi:MAG TPA: hypothetical protein VJK09_01830 [Candidatus Paceibacterota bacterium]
MRRLGRVNKKWSAKLAYAIGIIASDGNLSPDGRHINVTSKDEEIVLLAKKCLKINNKIGRKARGGSKEKKYYVLQFGDISFYEFLLKIGLTPAKSKTISKLNIPRKFIASFFRGCLDGDGNIDVFYHPESLRPQLRIRYFSASKKFLEWIKKELYFNLKLKGGWINSTKTNDMHVLVFGKQETIKILKFLYHDRSRFWLKRKYNLARPFLGAWRNWHTRSA